MNMMQSSATSSSPFTHGEGYLTFVGYLQLVAGALTAVFSLMTILLALDSGAMSLLNPLSVAETYGLASGAIMIRLIAGYMVFQVAFGWLFGLMMIVAGIMSLKYQGRRLITAVAIINLFNFPHGTTVGILVLHGLTRPGIAGAFHND